ncbi:MAG: efflux RND transporter permease subunit [Woeseiaceae bacterium]
MRRRQRTEQKGIIAWFASNHVAANLLMFLIIVAGVVSSFSLRKQTTPEFEQNVINISVPYLGAAPQEVEEGVVVKIEEAIQDVSGIVEINSTAREGTGTVSVEIDRDKNLDDVLNEIKTRVDAISTFPALTERPIYSKREFIIPVIFVTVHGPIDEMTRKRIADEVRDELLQLPEVNQVDFMGDRDFEISVEVSELTLRQYGLTMSEVSQAIRNSSVDLPGGSIRTSGGDILLRTEGQVYTGQEFGDLVLRTFPDGTRLLLSDIATIKDGFVETQGFGRFDGERSASLNIQARGQQNELETAAAVRSYVEQKRAELPEGVKISTWIDRSQYLQQRLDMMLDNLYAGAFLVLIVLALFLRLKVAMWVIVGIPITFLGALWLMPHGPWPTTINTISLFGFIVVLGIVVDDAIIIGESVYTKIRADGHTLDNVIQGARRVAVPATFGVLTTIAAFAPMLFVGGMAGPFLEAMSVVIILCLFFSLVESKLVLPAHLAQARIPDIDEDDLFNPQRRIDFWESIPRFFLKIQRHVQHGLNHVIANWYEPMLARAIDNRGITVASFVAFLIVTLGLLSGGMVRFVMFPEVPSDFIQMSLSMQVGTAPQVRNEVAARIETELLDMNAQHVAENPDALPMIDHLSVFGIGDDRAQMFVELPKSEDRPYEAVDITSMWRDAVGEVPGVKDMSFTYLQHIGGTPPLFFRLSGDNYEQLMAAATELQNHLRNYDGVFDVTNSALSGGDEIKLSIKPEAEALGITMSSLGRQVRQAFYGEEAQRIQRGREELRVMVRYPIEERRSVADLENMMIRTPTGDEVPFGSVAEVSFGEAYSRITRLNRIRTVTVSGDIDPLVVEPGQVIREITTDYIPQLLERFPGVEYGLEGSSQEEAELAMNMTVAAIAALFLIYALIAIPLHSYSLPLVIMSVIPFGAIGAVIGHLVMGMSMSMFSLFGLIALAGVVVNDSLIMIDFVNKAREQGMPIRQAVIESGTQRFRAIFLTSVTTAAGLAPILFESSMMAAFVVPAAVSLAFGIVFATVITLFLIPSLYVLQDDAFAWFSRLGGRNTGDSSVARSEIA